VSIGPVGRGPIQISVAANRNRRRLEPTELGLDIPDQFDSRVAQGHRAHRDRVAGVLPQMIDHGLEVIGDVIESVATVAGERLDLAS